MKEKPVKLLLAITKSNWGGAQRYVYDIAKHFKDNEGFHVTVLVGGHESLVSKLENIGIRVITIPILQRNVGVIQDIKSFYTITKILKEEKPDIIHLSSSKMGLFGVFAARLTRIKKIIFTAHGWPFNEARPYYQRFIFRCFALLTVLASHTTITVSQNVMTSLRAPRFLLRKINCIYTGIEPPKLYPPLQFFEDQKLTKTPGTHIVSIGELHTSKGFDRALIALAKCKHISWTYHIIGTGEKKEYLENLAISLEIRDRIYFHGFIENASLYLNSFDLFLFPSRTEALGYVAIEALFSKLPIIASNKGGIPEVLFDDPYTKIIECADEKIFKETLLFMFKKNISVNQNNRPGKLRFIQSFMFVATKKLYLS